MTVRDKKKWREVDVAITPSFFASHNLPLLLLAHFGMDNYTVPALCPQKRGRVNHVKRVMYVYL